jgi:hypothetical protein
MCPYFVVKGKIGAGFTPRRPPGPQLTVIFGRGRTVGGVRPQVVSRVRVLVHRREGVRPESPPGAGEAGVVRPRRPAVRVSRRRVEVVLVGRPQRAVAVLLELDEGALRDRRRVGGLVRRRRPYVRLPRHGVRRPGRVLVRPPERGPQVREVQRRERFAVHLGDELWRRLDYSRRTQPEIHIGHWEPLSLTTPRNHRKIDRGP